MICEVCLMSCPCRNKWSAQEIDKLRYLILIQLQCLYDKISKLNIIQTSIQFNNAEGYLIYERIP